MEMIVPNGMDISHVKQQLKQWIEESSSYKPKALVLAFFLPSILFFTKTGLIASVGLNMIGSYALFRCINYWRASQGGTLIRQLVLQQQVSFHSSEPFSKAIQETVTRITPHRSFNDDLDDRVIESIEKNYKLPELGRVYKRARYQHYFL
jgi:hypothetical protein